MKKVIILSVLVLLACQLYSQSKYKAGDIVVGKNAKYICKRGIGVTPYVRIDNSNNRDTTLNRYYNDGTLVDEFEETAASYRFGRSDLYSVVKLIFIKEELKLLKDNRVTLTIYFTTNNKGITTELGFGFLRDAIVFSTFDPDRFYELEKKLKPVLRLSIDESYQNIRNLKSMYSVDFKDIP